MSTLNMFSCYCIQWFPLRTHTFFSKSDHSCQRDWRQKTTFSMGDGKMTMLTLPAFATSVSKWLRLSRDRQCPCAAEKQLLYPGSLCGKLKRIVILPRRLQIKWHKPWRCSSSPIYPRIKDLRWFFSSSLMVCYVTGARVCTTEHRQACNHLVSHLGTVLLHQLGF